MASRRRSGSRERLSGGEARTLRPSLARLEFTIASSIRVHPMALLRFDELEDEDARRQIEALTVGYSDKADESLSV